MSDNQTTQMISIAIVTWNRCLEVLRAIQSVYDQEYPNFEVVVADNHSTDNTVASIESRFPRTKIIKLHCNLGATTGRNIALANCQGEIIFNLDDDAVLQANTLSVIMHFFTTAPLEVGLVACQIFEHGVYRCPEQSGPTAIFEACGWAIRRSVLQKVSYFSDRLFRQAEETDFAFNYLKAGYQMWYLSGAAIHHMPSTTRSNEEITFYKCRNELMIIFEYYPVGLILPFTIWTMISLTRYGITHPSHLPYIFNGFFSGLTKILECFTNRKPVPISVLLKVRFPSSNKSKISRFLAGQA